jgi:pyruvate dehydrogenase E2 component (dihydrolipoamide acetyltransferase)
MEHGTLARWLKREGDSVGKGDVIAEIETDKATMELEATEAGRIGRLLVGDGTADVPVDGVIALLLRDGETLPPESAAPADGATPPAMAVPIRNDGERQAKPAAPVAGARGPHASPLARRIAAQHDLDLSQLAGSGPNGRIVRIDVERARMAATTTLAAEESAEPEIASGLGRDVVDAGYTRVPHSSIRRTIARRLTQSKSTVPHFYLKTSCEVDALLALRAQINAMRDPADRVSVNDFVVKAEAMLVPESIDISVAVATEGGLITPIVRHADEKSLGTLSREIRELAARARENRLKPAEYQGGSFSVSNLGMYGVNEFAAIINPPQSCILAVGAAERHPVCKGDDIVAATIMNCTLSVDHRAVDGAVGAQLIGAFKELIETPLILLT